MTNASGSGSGDFSDGMGDSSDGMGDFTDGAGDSSDDDIPLKQAERADILVRLHGTDTSVF